MQGSQTFDSLNSRLESNRKEEDLVTLPEEVFGEAAFRVLHGSEARHHRFVVPGVAVVI
jgi:hypothetical protein